MSRKPSGVFISMSVPRRYVQKCAPCDTTPSRNAWPWTRLPISRPCMSVIAMTIVSMVPSRTSPSSSSNRGCFLPGPWSLMVSPVGRETIGLRPAGAGRTDLVRTSRRDRLLQLAGGALELPLDLGQLDVRALAPWAGKSRPRPEDVVQREQDQEAHHRRERGGVERERIQEERRDQDDPDDRDERQRAAPRAEAPGALVTPGLIPPQAEPDADPVCPIQQHGADAGHARDDEERVAAE